LIKKQRKANIANAFALCFYLCEANAIENLTEPTGFITLETLKVFISDNFDILISKNYFFKTLRIESKKVEESYQEKFNALSKIEQSFYN
jgi:hypothetical protein